MTVQQDTREAAADALLQAAHVFWKSEREAGMPGAVKWLTADDGSLLIFTRGEYRDALMRNIDEVTDKVYHFATPHPVQPEEAVARDAPDSIDRAMAFEATIKIMAGKCIPPRNWALRSRNAYERGWKDCCAALSRQQDAGGAKR